MSKDEGVIDDKTGLIYDLRQSYAKILTSILERVAYFREVNEYSLYYKALNDLRIEIMKNLKEKERVELNTVRNNLLETLEKYEAVLTKASNDPTERHIVEEALSNYEIKLKDYMEKHDFYGAKFDDSGL